MSDMVRRVAGIIRDEMDLCGNAAMPCVQLPDKCDCWEAGRAAIEAMREPTEAMLAATDGMDIMWEYHWQGGKPGSPADVWRVMIDRALADD